jgi:PTS hybrid protein
VSHSVEIARGLAELAGQVAGAGSRVIPAGGGPDGILGTSADIVEAAIDDADAGDGVVILADIGSAILTIKGVLAVQPNGHVRLADAPLVEGAIAAAVRRRRGCPLMT